jgi:glycosyltransferase involved in cell wall biosynthesis
VGDCGNGEPLRIGIDLTTIWRPATGTENLAIEMTQALLRTDQRNEYVLFFAREIHPKFAEFTKRFDTIVAGQSNELFLKNLWLPRAAAPAKLDYMHFPAFPPPWSFPCPTGWTLPDATPWLYPETMKLKSRWYYKVLGGRAVATSRFLITDTEASREDIVRHLGVRPERVHVIYPGLRSIFHFCHEAAAFESVRQRYRLPERFVLFVGTLEPRKNLRRILSAFRMLRTDRDFQPDLVIVGRKGWLYSPIFSELSRGGLARHVHVTGYVEDRDLVTLYNMARLLVFPSLYEGFGFPCIEAMACGCPVVTSSRGALQEVSAGSAAHADPENVTAIADAIWQVDSDEVLRQQLITKGLQRVVSFSWDRYAERFLNVLERGVPGEGADETSELCSSAL